MKYLVALIVVVACCSTVQCKSECEEHRDRELRPGNRFPKSALLIPKCTSSGDYEPLQCHGEPTEKKRACQCWDKNGTILTSPSFKLRACSCIMAKKEAEGSRGATVPTCEADGRFARKQCQGSKCHCVDPDTGKRENGNC